ncbi:DNA-binding MarR family transcriptional regulator [Catenulispora sp. MAP12-49]
MNMMGLNKSIPLDTQKSAVTALAGTRQWVAPTRKGGRPAVSEHTSVHTAEHEDEDEQELVPATGGSLAGRGHRPVRYRPSTGYLPWLLTMCDRELARHMTRLLAELDLTEAQYGVLQALVHLRRASSATLARSVSVTPQAMVGLVAALERKGYITREFGRGAGRVIDAEVTARGKEAYEAAKRRVRALDRSLRRSYTDEEFDQLVGLLERLPGVLGRLDDQRGSRRRADD